jgi:hypothetical protein
MVARICAKQSWPEPTYWKICRIQKSLPADLLTLSKDSAEYRRLFDMSRFQKCCSAASLPLLAGFQQFF